MSPITIKTTVDFTKATKLPTYFTKSSKNTTNFTLQSKKADSWSKPTKGSSDFTKPTKITTDFDINPAYEASTIPTWDDATVDWDDPDIYWDGAGGLSPITIKSKTDFTPSSKLPTDWTPN